MNDQIATLNALAEKIGIDVEDLKEILALFFKTIPAQIAQMQEAAHISDFETLHVISHTLKGTAANLFYEEISKAAGEIEQLCLAKNPIGYTPLLNKLQILASNAKMKICYT